MSEDDLLDLEFYVEFLNEIGADIDDIVDAEMDLIIAQQEVEDVQAFADEFFDGEVYEEPESEWQDFADEYGDDHWLWELDSIEEFQDFDDDEDAYAETTR